LGRGENEKVYDGFLFVARKLGDPDHWVWQLRPSPFRLFWWLLFKARWRAAEYRAPDGTLITVNRGQYAVALRRLAETTGLSLQETRTALNSLKRCEFLTHEVTHGITVITICNYEFYQDPASYSNTPSNKRLTQSQHKPNTLKNISNTGNTGNNYICEENMNAEEKRIFDEWNNHPHIWPKHRQFTTPMRRGVTARRRTLSVDEICKSIRNYGDSTDPFWVDHREVKKRWGLDIFLSQREGGRVDQFLDGPINEKQRHTGKVGGGRRFLSRGTGSG